MSEHIASVRSYVLIFSTLLVLTAVTIGVAFLNLGPLNTIIALSIAGVKAALVVLFFMHLRWGTALTKLFLVAGLLWLVILLVLTMNDYLTRDWMLRPEGWTGVAPAATSAVVAKTGS